MYRKLFIISLFLILILLCLLFINTAENNYHYCYVDLTNSVKVSPRCRRDKCEDLNGNVVSVKQFIDIRDK